MSLIKFLAAGRSVSNSGVSLPYREKKGVFLPKFGSPRNPFTKDVAANPTETPSDQARKEQSGRTENWRRQRKRG